MKRLQQHLLTHHPLLWNTRAVWVLLANAVLHLLFFFGGLVAVHTKSLVNHSSVDRVGGESLYTFSVLVSLLVLIVWCVYYLRNNAFKSFYRIQKHYLAKELGLIFLIILTSITYPQAFEWGVKRKVRSITSQTEMVWEMQTVNKAMVYLPVDRTPYFALNDCAEQARRLPDQVLDIDPGSEKASYRGADSVRVRLALERPDAFSYKHYCRSFLPYPFYNLETKEQISNRNKQWLAAGRQDSVRQSLAQLFAVLNKYGVLYRLNADSLTALVFSNSNFTVDEALPNQRYSYAYGAETENRYYLNAYDVSRLFELIEECQPSADNWQEKKITWNVYGYIALSLSVFLLCYRRFSRRVFLISIIGTLVWTILIGLFAITGGNNDLSVLLLVLCLGFLLLALGLLRQRRSKTATGVLLNWHVYLVPYAVMLITALIDDYHRQQEYTRFAGRIDADVLMQQHYPFSTWVVSHTAEIFLANAVFMLLYLAFLFNGWTRRWLLMPEE